MYNVSVSVSIATRPKLILFLVAFAFLSFTFVSHMNSTDLSVSEPASPLRAGDDVLSVCNVRGCEDLHI